MEKISIKHLFILVVLCYIYFIFGSSTLSLTNPDEVFYTQTAKEMVEHKTWMTPYLFDHPQFEKPIFLYWAMRVAFIFFGINSFSARLMPGLFGCIGVIAIYLFCLLGFKNRSKAFLTSLILLSSGIYVGLARTVFTDMIFSVFILLALLSFYWAYQVSKRKGVGLVLFFVFSALAVLTKGPLGILITLLTVMVFLALKKNLKFLFCGSSLLGFLLFLGISMPWYVLMILKYGRTFTHEFFYNDHFRRLIEAEHASNDTWYFYPLALIWGMFPWSLFAAASVFLFFKNLWRKFDTLHVFLFSWIVAVFVIFQPAHSKLVSYIFPCFPALAVIIADFIYEAAQRKERNNVLLAASLLTGAFLTIMLIGIIVMLNFFPQYIATYVSSKLPVYIMFSLLAAITVAFFYFTFKNKIIKSVYVLMLFIMAVFSVIPLIAKDIEPYISPRDTGIYLLENFKIDNTILCSKFFARGVRYYTGKSVAAMNPFGKDFFSPHPIPFLDQDEEVRDFLRSQKITYCVLKRSSVEDIDRQRGEFDIQLLKKIGNEYILKVEPLKK